MDAHEASKADEHTISAQLRGETIAYAVQSGIYNLAGNFFEPYLNYRVQKYHSSHDPSHPGYGNYTQNLAGEFAGDIIGASTLILAETVFPEQLHTFTRWGRRLVDPLYTSVAHMVFSKECKEPDYEQKIEKWKTFQERNLIRSAIMGVARIAGDVATQKSFIGNPSPTGVIFKGKLLSTALGIVAGLGVRFAFPNQTKRVDAWMGRNLFAPFMDDKKAPVNTIPASHADKLLSQKDAPAPLPAR